MTTFFTSDLHIGHGYVSKIRGFESVEDHDKAVVAAFRDVYPDDIVWIVGDICVSASGWTRALEMLSKLPGRKRLICGNHDPVSSIHREAWKFQRQALTVFETVQDFAKLKVNGRITLVSHYPYSGQGSERPGEEERYTEFRLTDRGTPLIHGHTHMETKHHISDRGTVQVHVGMDAWGMRLVPQHEVEKLLAIEPAVEEVS